MHLIKIAVQDIIMAFNWLLNYVSIRFPTHAYSDTVNRERIRWANFLRFLRGPRKFFHEHLAIVK